MAEPGEETAQTQSQQVAKLDLSKYRTRDLVEKLTELISIPGAFLQVMLTSFFLMIAVMITVVVMFYQSQINGLMWVVVCMYALLLAALLGPLLGVLRVIYRGLGNIEEILKLILGIAQQAADDTEQLQTGSRRLPSGSELVAQVYQDVLSPAIEEVIAGGFSIFGRPVLWLYRRTIGSSVRYLISKVEPPKLSEVQEVAIQTNLENGITGTAKYSLQIQTYTSNAAAVVNSVGVGIRFYVMRPLFVLYCGLLLVASLPILLYRWWVGIAAAEPPAIEANRAMESAVLLIQILFV